MKNLLDEYARAVGSWVANISTNGLARTVTAIDDMRQGQYGTERFTTDVYEYWRDIVDFRAQAALGILPIASLDISSWAGNAVSNFVQVPAGSFALGVLQLTPVANPQTTTALTGLSLAANGGENSVRVQFVSASAGAQPTGADKNGLFQGGIFRTDAGGELIALVYARTHLP